MRRVGEAGVAHPQADRAGRPVGGLRVEEKIAVVGRLPHGWGG